MPILSNYKASSAALSAAVAAEQSAALSATRAQNAIADLFISGIAGASVPDVPIPLTGTAIAGHHYRITSAGTSQSKTWAIGDAAIYNGTSGAWTQLTGFFAGAITYIDTVVAQRDGVDQIISDGTTPNRAMVQTPGDRGNLAGAAAATWWGLVTIPSAASSAAIAILYSSATWGSPFAYAHTIEFEVNALKVMRIGATVADSRKFSHSTLRTLYAGQTGLLEVYFVNGTANPVVRWNDAIVSGFSLTTSGSPPEWLGADTVSATWLTGREFPAGSAPIGGWINGALSDADRAYRRATGKPPLWVAMGGSAVNLKTNPSFETYSGTQNDGTSDTFTGWATNTTDGIVESISAGRTGNAVKLTRAATTGQNNHRIITSSAPVVAGKYRVTVWTKGDGTNSLRVEAFVAGAGTILASTSTGLTATSWQQYTVEFSTPVSGNLEFTLSTPMSVGAVIQVDDFSLTQLGALSLPLIQRGGVVGDATMIADNPARLVGMRAITDKKDFIWTATVDTSAIATVQLLGGPVFTDPTQIALDSIDRRGTGAETASLGDGTTPTRYTASAARSATLQRLTLTEFYPSDSAKTGLYYSITAGAASTKAQLTVRGHVIP